VDEAQLDTELLVVDCDGWKAVRRLGRDRDWKLAAGQEAGGIAGKRGQVRFRQPASQSFGSQCRDQHVHRAAAGGPNKATSRCATSLARWGRSVSARDVFCDKGECLTRVGKSLVASDMLHLTRSGSEFLVSSIVSKLGVE